MADLFALGTSPQTWIGVSQGSTKEWSIKIDTLKGYLGIKVSGLNVGTDITVTLKPNFFSGSADTRTFPDALTGSGSCQGINTDANIKLKCQSGYPSSNTIPDFYLPKGEYQLLLTANKANSQVRVWCNTTPIDEEVSVPSKPDGPTSVSVGSSSSYNIGGSTSSSGHTVGYQVDWGDDSGLSNWAVAGTFSHTFSTSGTFDVKVHARCQSHTTVLSESYSTVLKVTAGTSAETVSSPIIPSGPTTGSPSTSYSYTASGSVDNLGHAVEYSFDWGDSTVKAWGLASQSHSWTAGATYHVKCQARCITHPEILSGWSPELTTVISGGTGTETVSKPVLTGSTTPPDIPEPTIYTCSIDGLTFLSQALLDAHIALAHPTNPPPTPPPGEYTAIIALANDMDTQIVGHSGWGYYQGCTPNNVYCNKTKTTYFYIDTSWRSVFLSKVSFINFDVVGPSQTTKLIKLDVNDSGTVLNTYNSKQSWFNLPTQGRYLISVTCTENIYVSIWWGP